MKNKCKYALRSTINGYYYNGNSEGIFFLQEVCRPSEISDRYIYASKEIAELELKRISRMHDYVVEKIELFEKPKCPYEIYGSTPPVLKRGGSGEVCTNCGINIVPDEPYVYWQRGCVFCLHCLEYELSKTNELYKDTPKSLKDEWNEYGKEEFKKCMADI
jgi:hypothetical protein